MIRKTVGEVCCKKLIAVDPDRSAADAVRTMRDHRISCIVVVEDGAAAGIFTERDIVRLVSRQGSDFLNRPIREVMSGSVLTTDQDAFLYKAFERLVDNHIRHLVVVDEADRAIGVITQSDMLAHLGYEYFIKLKTISQVMNRLVWTIPREKTVIDASREMTEKVVSFLVVCEDGRPVGVLTERDVARLAAERRDVASLAVGEVMSSPVVTVTNETPAIEAAEIMKQKEIRRLVVVGKDGRAVGVTTQRDMIRGLEGRYIDTLRQIISEQGKELDRTIRELSEKSLYLDSILRSSIDMGIVATDASLKIVYFNPVAELLLGRKSREVLGLNVRDVHVMEGVEAGRLEQALDLVRNRKRHAFSFERQTREGKRYVQARVYGIWGKSGAVGYLLMLQDVTDRRKAEEAVRYMAYYDILTDLPNRALFNERLGLELARARRSGKPLALMLLDLDRFKEVNDTLGHAAGDDLLKAVAAQLKARLRESDTVARVGGDEFIFILPEVGDRQDAARIAEKILGELKGGFAVAGRSLSMNFSLGVALHPADGEDAETLLRHADQAMYRAKDLGRTNRDSNVCLHGEA